MLSHWKSKHMRSRSLLLPALLVVAASSFTEMAAATFNAPLFQDIDLDQEAENIKVRRAKQEYMASQYIEKGDQAFDIADLDQALIDYSNALAVMPSNQAARKRLIKVEAAMGNRYAEADETLANLVDREIVKRAQAMMAAESAARKGDAALIKGDFDDAIASYQEAQLILTYFPIIAEGNLTGEVVKGKLASAKALREEAMIQAAEERQARAEQAAMDAAAAERERMRNQLNGLYADAYLEFNRENYSEAVDLCEQVLGLDPGNPYAQELRTIAVAAGNKKANEETQDRLREEWIKTFEELNHLGIPQTRSVEFNDFGYLTEVNNRRPITLGDPEATNDAVRDGILAILDRTPVTPRFGDEDEGAPIEDVAAFLQSLTGLNFVVTTQVLEDLDPDETSISMTLPRMTVRRVLDLIADTSPSMRWKVEDGVVKFVTIDQMTGGQVLQLYAVSDLIRPVADFPARVINVSPSGGLEQPEEDLEEREAMVVTSDTLDALIRDNVDPESWDADEANSLRITEHGVLVVNQTIEVHKKIEKLLEDLRESTGIMVDIEARFLKVEDSFLEDIGVDFRGLGSPGKGTNEAFNDFGSASAFADLGGEIGTSTDVGAFLDEGQNGDIKARVENLYDQSLGSDEFQASGGLSFSWTFINDLQFQMILRAVNKAERIQQVTAPHVLVANTARSNLSVTNQLSYVQDFNVEIATGASIADPIVQTIQEGVILDVRPIVSADRRFIVIEVRPTVATLRRPIRELTTGLASASSVTVQLPELEIARMGTTVPIPDGGTILLGGWKVHEEQNYSSGVPILNKIPLISAFFSRKGNYINNRKLLILLKASIVLWQEHTPSKAQLGIFGE